MTNTPTTKMLYHEGTGTLIHMGESDLYLVDLDLISEDEMDDLVEMPHHFADRFTKVVFTNATEVRDVIEL